MRALAVVAALAGSAYGKPVGTFVPVPRHGVAAAAPSSKIIYVKRCPSSGCVVHFGTVDDSRTQTTSISGGGDKTIGGFSQGDQIWSDLMDCVRTTYSPFGVTVTDVDPGSTVPHFENLVGGKPSDLDPTLPANVGGIAPFDCVEIPNAITYTFDVYGPDAYSLCATVAQETAHAFGLDHEYLAQDPMTYLPGYYPKRFQDDDSQCGRFQLETCMCGRTTQNSYRMIVGLFGPGAPITPDVMILRPSDGKVVQPGFAVSATATSIVRIDHVELYVDGVLAGMATMAPYVITLDGIDPGEHAIEVRAIDVQGTPGSATATITMGPPCTADKGCSDGDVCVMGVCIAGPSEPGGLGVECTSNDQCNSMQCVNGGEALEHCGAPCDPNVGGVCPHGFACESDGAGNGTCYPTPDAGCCNAGGSPAGAFALAAAVGAMIARRRRR